MTDASAVVGGTAHDYRSVGTIIGGLVGLKSISDEIFVLLPGRTLRAPSADVTVDEAGISVLGEQVIPFRGTTGWDLCYDGPCISFTLADQKDGIVAPAVRPSGMDVSHEIERFLESCDEGDDVFLNDLSGHVATADPDPARRLAMRGGAFTDTDTLVVLGHDLPLGDVVWADRDQDGDGNRYLNLVLGDGRYLRVSVGDFSR